MFNFVRNPLFCQTACCAVALLFSFHLSVSVGKVEALLHFCLALCGWKNANVLTLYFGFLFVMLIDFHKNKYSVKDNNNCQCRD